MDTLFKLTPQQSDVLLAFYKSSVPGETKYLNPSDATEREFVMTMLAAAGRSATDYPHLFQALNTSGAYTGDPGLDGVKLVDAGKTASGKVTSTVWSRSGGDTIIKVDHLLVFDADSGELLAQGENSSVRRGFVNCPTRPESAAQAGKNLSILHLGYAAEGDGTSRFFSYANKAMVAEGQIPVTISAPVIQHSQNTDIWIAVGRTAGQWTPPANTDYIYVATASQDTDPNLIVPFVGSAELSGTIDIGELTIENLYTSVWVNNTNGSAAEIERDVTYTTDAGMVAAFSVGSSPDILQWSFPFDGVGYQTTTSIVYNTTNMGNETDSYFLFQFNGIPFTDGTTAPTFYVCSTGTPNEPSMQCTIIPNIYFEWHCLAKGTLVTLEDGSQKPIENIDQTFRVQTGTEEKSLAVIGTVLGRHRSDTSLNDSKEVFRLTTANGKSIVATSNHMVFISQGKCRRIVDLKRDDPILTDTGLSTVLSNEAIDYEDMFYALLLGSPEEQADADFPLHMTNHYANGILCGDQQTTIHQIKAMYDDLDYMLPRIRQEIHQDYTSALKHRRS